MGKYLTFLALFWGLCGCTASPKKTIIADALDSTPVVTGSVANPKAFEGGGTLVLDTFKPGPGAAADDMTDQLSMLILKGIQDTLPTAGSHFVIQTDNRREPDFLMEGFIENYGHNAHGSVLFSVDGDIWLHGTGEKILLFQTSITLDSKTQDPNASAYQIGCAIARFIGSPHGE